MLEYDERNYEKEAMKMLLKSSLSERLRQMSNDRPLLEACPRPPEADETLCD